MVVRALVWAAALGAAWWLLTTKPVRRLAGARPELDELAPDMRAKVGKLLSELEGDGYTFKVLDVARTLEEQTAIFDADDGRTRTMNSRHLGAPGSARAVDLAPVSTPDGAASTDELRAQAYIALRDAAPAYGLETGGTWSKDGGKWSAYGLGWDPGHVQEAL